MPMTPTGKIDQQALQNIEARRPELAQSYVAPRDNFETCIALRMAELLGLDRVGMTDNFFALGGQSLTAARLISDTITMFPQRTGSDSTMKQQALLSAFVLDPTVENLCTALLQVVHSEETHEPASLLQCIKKGEADHPPLFLLHGVLMGEAFYAWNMAQALDVTQPFYTLAPHGYHGSHVPDTIEEMATDYLRYVRTIQPNGPYHFIGYCNGGLVAFEMARILRREGEEVSTLILVASPGKNVRYAPFRAFIEPLNYIPGMHAARRRSLFANTLEALRYSKYVAAYVCDIVRALTSHERAHIVSPNERYRSANMRGSAEERADLRFSRMMKAIDAYVPLKYDGRLVLVWGKRDESLVGSNPRREWSSIVRDLHVEFVDGDHDIVNTHFDKILEHISPRKTVIR